MGTFPPSSRGTGATPRAKAKEKFSAAGQLAMEAMTIIPLVRTKSSWAKVASAMLRTERAPASLRR